MPDHYNKKKKGSHKKDIEDMKKSVDKFLKTSEIFADNKTSREALMEQENKDRIIPYSDRRLKEHQDALKRETKRGKSLTGERAKKNKKLVNFLKKKIVENVEKGLTDKEKGEKKRAIERQRNKKK